jgi:hypothetical protein
MTNREVEFYLNLIVAGTRVWEAFGRNSVGEPRFKEWISEEKKVLQMIVGDANRILVALTNGVIITDFKDEESLTKA